MIRDSLGALFHAGSFVGLTDGQLLERFALRDGEAAEQAFAALVERHGRAVLGTCRAVLRDDHEASDAFQATFLVLVRKARTLWVRDSLGPWLHRVAYRVAAHARRDSARRKRAECEAAERASPWMSGVGCDDLVSVVHEEVERLPERYRIPVVLCDLEGRTYEEAARHVGRPVGTVKSRLARGRECLRRRLVRRGMDASSGLIALRSSMTARLPDGLLTRTIRLAIGPAEAGMVPASVASLVNQTLGDMIMRKLVGISFVTLLLGLASMRVDAFWPAGGGPQTISSTSGQSQSIAEKSASDRKEILGRWVRVSTNGRKEELLVKMEIKEDPDGPGDDLPAGAARYLFSWKTEGHGESRNRVQLNPTEKPKAIDFFPEQAGAPKILPGIYRVEGDTLTICFKAVSGERPSGFVDFKVGEILDVYTRVK